MTVLHSLWTEENVDIRGNITTLFNFVICGKSSTEKKVLKINLLLLKLDLNAFFLRIGICFKVWLQNGSYGNVFKPWS